MTRQQRELLARRRILKNLDALTAANMRTIEMKIADSGPPNMRVQPHILTVARNALVEEGRLARNGIWYYRTDAPTDRVTARLTLLKELHALTISRGLVVRLGQSLEIAVFRALGQSSINFVGGFPGLESHDDGKLYTKEEPPLNFSGRRMPGSTRFDFLAFVGTHHLGIECKNVREWMYPNRQEVKELLLKAVGTNTIPFLIARRIPYVTFRLLGACGVILFENFNQLYPFSESTLADRVQFKGDLGYHDVRAGNDANPRLIAFLQKLSEDKVGQSRVRFDRFKDLLEAFASGKISYASFAARVRRREGGMPEDRDGDDDLGDPDDMF